MFPCSWCGAGVLCPRLGVGWVGGGGCGWVECRWTCGLDALGFGMLLGPEMTPGLVGVFSGGWPVVLLVV
jgi:hypothetical protein